MTPGDQQQITLCGLGEPGGLLHLECSVAYHCLVEEVKLFAIYARLTEIKINNRYLLYSARGWSTAVVVEPGGLIEVEVTAGDEQEQIVVVILMRALEPPAPAVKLSDQTTPALENLRAEVEKFVEAQRAKERDLLPQQMREIAAKISREIGQLPPDKPAKERFIDRLRGRRSGAPAVTEPPEPAPPLPPQPTRFSELDIEDDE